MSYQNISAELTAQQITTINTAIATIQSQLPFLIALSEEERKTITKMGSKSVDFVQDAAEAVNSFPDITPGNFNKAEYFKDANLVKHLFAIKLKMDVLQQKIDDTLMAAGHEAMMSSLEVYAILQAQEDRVPGLRAVTDKLKVRWKKTKRKSDSPEIPID